MVRDATLGRGVDVILDNMGAKHFRAMSRPRHGRSIGHHRDAGRSQGELDIATLLRKRRRPCHVPARPPGRGEGSIVASVREHVWPMIASGRVRPIVNSTHRLADAAAAHRELEASGHVGKILLQP